MSALLLITGLALASAATPIQSKCKAVPESPDWPSSSAWQSLNTTLGGNLLAPLPPAIVCDTSADQFFADACRTLSTSWFNAEFHGADPVSVDWPNWQQDACVPPVLTNNKSIPCDLKPFPFYVVNASTHQQVTKAVEFANEKGLRLTVKGTGHDFLGRSTGEGLSIWTHHLRGIDFLDYQVHDEFIPAVKVAAGHTWSEVYSTVTPRGVFVIGGADPNVGIGGFLIGGGHSPIGTKYGLGADNVLEMEVVTPQGEIVTTNGCEKSDLFWAMRGGGPGFGILLSATLRTIPLTPSVRFTLNITSTQDEAASNNNNAFYNLAANFHVQIPWLSEAGLGGYYYIMSKALFDAVFLGRLEASNPPQSTEPVPMTLLFAGQLLEGSPEDVEDAFAPLLEKADIGGEFEASLTTTPVATFAEGIAGIAGAVGINAIMTSRLWDANSLSDHARLAETLRVFEKEPLLGHLVIGPGVHQGDADSVAVNPAWRSAWTHILTTTTFPYRDKTAKSAVADHITNVLGKALRDLAPDTGAYPNEADVNEPDFGKAFWGDHYPRLLELKDRLDPDGVFWCKACVGSEQWQKGEDGTVCRV